MVVIVTSIVISIIIVVVVIGIIIMTIVNVMIISNDTTIREGNPQSENVMENSMSICIIVSFCTFMGWVRHTNLLNHGQVMYLPFVG